ncbi:acetate--CoA ligase family protein [Allosalinactinospora lopnorensis]|uniref:acetate--CoA ligase family protein n=1 Tax=Allosalinactinospora lopnorensis TaxID=1352348 RepID=UPI001F2C5C89|nr:acetate--CoA ligase family protein [Allosalinactinospora lopnorensis]
MSSNDLLMWWESDAETAMALVHVESFGNPRKFSQLARRLGRRMPILTVHAGRSAAGQRAAASHTAAAVTPALTTEALFRQAGVTATRGIGELVGTAALLAHQPLPAGPRVAIVTNAGGTGVLAADACADAGLEVCELSPETSREFEWHLPAGAACANPVDTTPSVRSDQLRACLESLSAAPEVDAIIAIMVPTALTQPESAILPTARATPVIAVSPDQAESVTTVRMGEHAVTPCYGSPEGAAAALGHAWERARWLVRPAGSKPDLPGLATHRVGRIVRDFLARSPEGGWLPLEQAMELLECYAIPVAPWRRVGSADEAARAAAALGGPVAVKADLAGVVHKKRAGALRLDLSGDEEVREAYDAVAGRFEGDLRGVLVQAMAPRGFEVLFGVTQQPVFGPLIVCGLGGTYTDALRTRAARLAPLTDLDAAELVRSVRALRELGEHSGDEAVNLASLEDVALRLSRVVEDLPEVAELDMNPLMAGPSGVTCVDTRVRLTIRPHGDPYLRALRFP